MRCRAPAALAAGLLAGGLALPAVSAAQPAPDGVQIILVLDVSGSMGEYVLDEDLLLEIRDVLDELAGARALVDEADARPEVAALRDDIERLEHDPGLVDLDAAFDRATAARSDWLADHGYGEFGDVSEALRRHLADLGCNEFLFASIVSSADAAEADTWIDMACGEGVLTGDERRSIHDLVPFLEDPGYAALDEAVDDAFDALDAARRDLGIPGLQVDLYEILDDAGYYEALDRITQLEEDVEDRARAAGYPQKLDLARSAAHILLDLSALDLAASGVATGLGLAVFSTDAELRHEMTGDLDAVGTEIDRLAPLDQTNLGGGMIVALDELERLRDPGLPAAIILLSDGHSNEGMPIAEILRTVPERAGEIDAVVCSAGFATTEEEVDADLLRGLAEQTGGEYLFVTRGEELTSFFVACRQGLFGSVVERSTGTASTGPSEAGTIAVPGNTCELTAVVSYLDAAPAVRLLGPAGNEAAADVRQSGNVLLITVADPAPGDWTAEVSSEAGDLLYSLVLSTEECTAPPATTVPQAAPAPAPADEGGGGAGSVVAVVAMVAVAAGAAAVWSFVLRRRGGRAGTGTAG